MQQYFHLYGLQVLSKGLQDQINILLTSVSMSRLSSWSDVFRCTALCHLDYHHVASEYMYRSIFTDTTRCRRMTLNPHTCVHTHIHILSSNVLDLTVICKQNILVQNNIRLRGLGIDMLRG
jgi:hypothetical protein